MRIVKNIDALIRRKKYDLIREGNTCCCGAYKWSGTAFCRGCTNRLPQKYRAALFTSDPVAWPAAYDSAGAYLEKGGNGHV